MEELQNLATFLIADGCEWLTGQTITLDGGQSHATGSNFYALRHWTDAQWQAARDAMAASEKLIKANVLFRLAPAPWALYRKREERRMDTATSLGRRALRASSGK
jgi:hypothetical protein